MNITANGSAIVTGFVKGSGTIENLHYFMCSTPLPFFSKICKFGERFLLSISKKNDTTLVMKFVKSTRF